MKLFYRQKVLLGVLQAFGGKLSSINMQKYLFLFTERCQKDKSYEFVPYKFGCFSFQSCADGRKLVEKGVLDAEDGWSISKEHDFISMLDVGDQRKISLFAEKYSDTKGDDLVREVYKKYPYYAIKSEIAADLMTAEEQEKIKACTPVAADKVLFTIGYEGNSFENYLNRLIKKNVKLLVDVRKNPLSRKYGFSKGTLSKTLEKLGIEYLHKPELGIVSEKRKDLKTDRDYQLLFEAYKQTVIKDNQKSLKDLLRLVKSKKRIALTCFEAKPSECHRGQVAEAIERLPAWNYEVVHI